MKTIYRLTLVVTALIFDLPFVIDWLRCVFVYGHEKRFATVMIEYILVIEISIKADIWYLNKFSKTFEETSNIENTNLFILDSISNFI